MLSVEIMRWAGRGGGGEIGGGGGRREMWRVRGCFALLWRWRYIGHTV